MSEPGEQRNYLQSEQPEIIRLNQQDDYYQNYLKSKIIEALEIFMPWLLSYRVLSRNEDLLKMISAVVYYGLTTLRSSQTLGEEYTNLAQYNEKDKGVNWQNFPNISRTRKIMFVFFAAVFPFISQKVFKKVYNSLKQKIYLQLDNSSLLKILIKNLPDYDSFVQSLFKINLAVFFIDGLYLQISKRFTSVKYIYTKRPQEHGLSYYNVGRLMLIQIVIEISKYFYKSYKTYLTRKNKNLSKSHESNLAMRQEVSQSTMNDESKTCPLCFDVRKNTAATPCGHLFCWECIMKNCLIKEECPQCRKICKPNKIIQIRNFG